MRSAVEGYDDIAIKKRVSVISSLSMESGKGQYGLPSFSSLITELSRSLYPEGFSI